MVRKLLFAYLRVGAGALNLALRTAERGGILAVGVVRSVVPTPPPATAPPAYGDVAFDARSEPETEPEPEPEPAPPDTSAYQEPPATPLDEREAVAKTIDDEPELVAEFAEPGAEGGAGPEVEVDEPWDGYGGMTTDEVIARVREADAAEIAVVEFYEQAHKRRQSVLDAAERRRRALQNAPH